MKISSIVVAFLENISFTCVMCRYLFYILFFFLFKEKFDGYVFIDRDGSESQCLVEYSAYQKTPNATKKTKKDVKSETIDEDPDFIGIFL